MCEVLDTFRRNPEALTGNKSGQGQFSSVMFTPCGKYAVKHSLHGWSDAWLLYAVKLLTIPKEQRPEWAPMVHSIQINIDSGQFVALMDAYRELGEYDGPTVNGKLRPLHNYLMLESGEFSDNEPFIPSKDMDGEILVDAAFYPIRECMDFLRAIELSSGIEFLWDAGGNCMWDEVNGRVIMNDPVAVLDWHSILDTDAHKEEMQEYILNCAAHAPDLILRRKYEPEGNI